MGKWSKTGKYAITSARARKISSGPIFTKFSKVGCASTGKKRLQGCQNRDLFGFSKNFKYFLSESVPIVKIGPELNFLALAEVRADLLVFDHLPISGQNCWKKTEFLGFRACFSKTKNFLLSGPIELNFFLNESWNAGKFRKNLIFPIPALLGPIRARYHH